MKHNLWKLRLCNSLEGSWFSSMLHLMKTKPKIKPKWSMRLTLWASLPIIVNIWTSGFSGKVLPCKMCRKSRVIQPVHCLWPVTLHATCHDHATPGQRCSFLSGTVPMWPEKQITVEIQLFWRPLCLTKILRWREICPDIPASVWGLLFMRRWWWPTLALLLPACGCCSWWQLHSIPRKGWVMPLSPRCFSVGGAPVDSVPMLSQGLIISKGWSSLWWVFSWWLLNSLCPLHDANNKIMASFAKGINI